MLEQQSLGLSVQHISNSILQDISFELEPGQLATFIGSTGAGKTTLLRAIAGLSPITQGKIFLNGQDISKFPSFQRKIAMLFQHHVLFPQRTVYGNILFALSRQKLKSSDIKTRSQEIAEIVSATELLARYPETLSGGEQQRAALAQILALHPNILLLDEPLTHLDLPSQSHLRETIRRIPTTLHIPVLVVTHQPYETLAMSDKLGVLQKGKLLQWDTPQNIYHHPCNTWVSQLLGIKQPS